MFSSFPPSKLRDGGGDIRLREGGLLVLPHPHGADIVGGKLPLHAGDSGGSIQQPLRAVDLQQQDIRPAGTA